nr:immunoglobulin light chain junction region [Macaca mulatta]MOW52276.1 immunoglobulin light chain junction region [Macaca mulatta]MOW52371.1 immunoglobulin light chain junction region [Macaca mulatta]MOW52664.1 immunoglobulin light chain junction region [Macaca mulatta]MOW52916.1 immunoglobulin light chain junction region [Macaca mulatta]
CLQGHSTPFTF